MSFFVKLGIWDKKHIPSEQIFQITFFDICEAEQNIKHLKICVSSISFTSEPKLWIYLKTKPPSCLHLKWVKKKQKKNITLTKIEVSTKCFINTLYILKSFNGILCLQKIVLRLTFPTCLYSITSWYMTNQSNTWWRSAITSHLYLSITASSCFILILALYDILILNQSSASKNNVSCGLSPKKGTVSGRFTKISFDITRNICSLSRRHFINKWWIIIRLNRKKKTNYSKKLSIYNYRSNFGHS